VKRCVSVPDELPGRCRFLWRCAEHFKVKQRLFCFGFINETDCQSRVNDDIITGLCFRDTGHLTFSLYAPKFDQTAAKHRIPIQPLQQFSGYSKTHHVSPVLL